MSNFLHLEYGHISDYEPEELLRFSDEWCEGIVETKRKQESQLARLLLDKILKKTIDKSITEADFGKKEEGMPFLKKHPEFFVSITHSHGHVWTALADSPIGIDFEKIDPAFKNDLKIAFDSEDWHSVSENLFDVYKYFSLKESYSKMLGTGFDTEPSSIKIRELSDKSLVNFFEIKDSIYVFTIIASNFEPGNFLKLHKFLQILNKS